jgi:hypothetical protein
MMDAAQEKTPEGHILLVICAPEMNNPNGGEVPVVFASNTSLQSMKELVAGLAKIIDGHIEDMKNGESTKH